MGLWPVFLKMVFQQVIRKQDLLSVCNKLGDWGLDVQEQPGL